MANLTRQITLYKDVPIIDNNEKLIHETAGEKNAWFGKYAHVSFIDEGNFRETDGVVTCEYRVLVNPYVPPERINYLSATLLYQSADGTTYGETSYFFVDSFEIMDTETNGYGDLGLVRFFIRLDVWQTFANGFLNTWGARKNVALYGGTLTGYSAPFSVDFATTAVTYYDPPIEGVGGGTLRDYPVFLPQEPNPDTDNVYIEKAYKQDREYYRGVVLVSVDRTDAGGINRVQQIVLVSKPLSADSMFFLRDRVAGGTRVFVKPYIDNGGTISYGEKIDIGTYKTSAIFFVPEKWIDAREDSGIYYLHGGEEDIVNEDLFVADFKEKEINIDFDAFSETSLDPDVQLLETATRTSVFSTVYVGTAFHKIKIPPYAIANGNPRVSVFVHVGVDTLSILLRSPYGEIDITSDFEAKTLIDVSGNFYQQNKDSLKLGLLAAGISTVGGVVSKNPIAIAQGLLSGAQTYTNFSEGLKQPPQIAGGSGYADVTVEAGCISLYRYPAVNANQLNDAVKTVGYSCYIPMTREFDFVTSFLGEKTQAFYKIDNANFNGIPQRVCNEFREIFSRGVLVWYSAERYERRIY